MPQPALLTDPKTTTIQGINVTLTPDMWPEGTDLVVQCQNLVVAGSASRPAQKLFVYAQTVQGGGNTFDLSGGPPQSNYAPGDKPAPASPGNAGTPGTPGSPGAAGGAVSLVVTGSLTGDFSLTANGGNGGRGQDGGDGGAGSPGANGQDAVIDQGPWYNPGDYVAQDATPGAAGGHGMPGGAAGVSGAGGAGGQVSLAIQFRSGNLNISSNPGLGGSAASPGNGGPGGPGGLGGRHASCNTYCQGGPAAHCTTICGLTDDRAASGSQGAVGALGPAGSAGAPGTRGTVLNNAIAPGDFIVKYPASLPFLQYLVSQAQSLLSTGQAADAAQAKATLTWVAEITPDPAGPYMNVEDAQARAQIHQQAQQLLAKLTASS